MRNEPIHRSAGSVPIGAEVITRDGDGLGTVKEIQGGYFKVAASLRPDYWLQLITARVDGAGRVVMEFDKDDLDRYRVIEPDTSLDGGGASYATGANDPHVRTNDNPGAMSRDA
ncbi:MAG: hypothetical protein U0531_00900 [Dehalococcoidia bacterium]